MSEPGVVSPQPIVAEVVRSGFVEGRHYGSAVALSAGGAISWELGDPRRPLLPRSCLKPLQALGLLRLGLELPDDLLALACSSHSAEAVHLAGVRRILGLAGLDESSLQTPPDLPLDPEERDALLRAGGGPAPILMNCSAKHAAMLVTCVVNGWGIVDYLDPFHPLQRAVTATVTELTGEPTETAVDGCGAPALSASLAGMARAFRQFALGEVGGLPDVHARRIADAIRGYPELVSGSRRDEARLLRAVPGAIAKSGAEACFLVALPDGRTWGLKIDDGADRARAVVMAALLLRDGVGGEAGVDAGELESLSSFELLGGGVPVGEVRAALPG